MVTVEAITEPASEVTTTAALLKGAPVAAIPLTFLSPDAEPIEELPPPPQPASDINRAVATLKLVFENSMKTFLFNGYVKSDFIEPDIVQCRKCFFVAIMLVTENKSLLL